MGNRAVITTAPYSVNNTGIYVHWNGGRGSVEAFLKACKELGYRSPETDPEYAMARLTQVIGTYFGGTLSLGIGPLKTLDGDNGDNGVYVIGGDWEIVGRKHHGGFDELVGPNEQIVADIMAKLAELVDAEVRHLDGTRFNIVGMKGDRCVCIEQDMIVNVSSKGTLFNQFPARIYVDGKFTSAAKFAAL